MKDHEVGEGSSNAGGRWTARAGDETPEARAGALLRQAVRPEPLEAEQLAAIRERLRRERRRPQRNRALRLAIACGLVLTGSALTAAAQRYLHWLAPAPPTPPAPAADPVPHARRARAAADAPALAPAPEATVPAPPVPAETAFLPDPTPRVQAPPEGTRRVVPTAPRIDPAPVAVAPAAVTPLPAAAAEPRPASPPPASALAQESALLAEALRQLRQDDDARAALAVLDERDVLFGPGALAPEATLARIEALIKLRRNRDALNLLDRVEPAARGSGRDLLIARAELRAAAGRCAAAEADFDRLLRRGPPVDPITERALWGRAACRAAAGDGAGARSDLTDYLALFPDGRFAREARGALGP